MKALKKIHIIAFFLLSLFFVSGFFSSLPIFSGNILVKNYLQQSADHSSGEAEEKTIEKEEAKILFDLSDLNITAEQVLKIKLPVSNDQCLHLFTPAITVPPPEQS